MNYVYLSIFFLKIFMNVYNPQPRTFSPKILIISTNYHRGIESPMGSPPDEGIYFEPL